jgi:hypothetical protein
VCNLLTSYQAGEGHEEAVELLLEGLHLHRRLNKDRVAGGVLYRR